MRRPGVPPRVLFQLKRVAFGAMAACLAIGLLVSPLPMRSLWAGAYLVSGMACYLIISRMALTPKRWRLILWAPLIAAGALSALVAAPRLIPPGYADWLAAAVNPNVAAGAMVLLAPFVAAQLLSGPAIDRLLWRAAVVAGGALVVALPLTQSRAAYLASLAAIMLVLVLRWPRLAKWLPGLGLAALGIGTWLGWQRVADALVQGGAVSGLDQRLEIWSRALLLIGDFPLTGSGPGCFEPIVARFYPLFHLSKTTVSHAHNLYLQVAVDLGLPGLAAYLVLLITSTYQGAATYGAFRAARSDRMLFAAACLGALLGVALHGLIDCAAWGNKLAFLPWVVMGLCSALARHTF